MSKLSDGILTPLLREGGEFLDTFVLTHSPFLIIGCPTSERQPGGKVFGVTRKVLSNSKHTLLLPLFRSNRKAFE